MGEGGQKVPKWNFLIHVYILYSMLFYIPIQKQIGHQPWWLFLKFILKQLEIIIFYDVTSKATKYYISSTAFIIDEHF